LKVLVTGAAGFIGSHLLPKLIEAGHEVIALDKAPITAHSLKIKNYLDDILTIPSKVIWKDQIFDAVIHLAAIAAPRYAEKNPDETFKTNVFGTYNVLRMAKEADANRFIFASTAHVYGISPKYMPTDENHPLSLGDTYTTSKILGEQLCELFFQNHDIPYTIMRLFNGYGPRQSKDYFIPAMIDQAIKARCFSHPDNRKIVLRGREITKDFIYVDDVAEAIVKALSFSSGYVGALNIGTGIQTPLEVVARYIADYFDVELKFEDTYDRGPTHMQCNPSRAERILGWRAKTKIEGGLKKTCDYFMRLLQVGVVRDG